ncbi:F-box only protein 6-like isoform X2 [Eleutherodactylus coqui]|uniref:F-box only protein 6-like isoform X2 n=1 Tax=Eleutherodactylus coqui TaxID=57060 RepID=UPI0034637229
MLDYNILPEEVHLHILSLVPATDLIRHCTLVCTLWRDVINSPTLWKTKCQHMGYTSKESLRTPKDWKLFYYLSSKKRNLLRNSCAMEKLKFWKIEQNGGDQWAIEDLPGTHGQDFPDKDVTKYFVTSYRFAARHDCGSQYKLVVQLLSEEKKPLKVFDPDTVMIEQWSDARWHQMEHTFRDYGPGVRYIYFQHGGQDTQFWAGRYGIRVTGSSVTIEPEDLTA